MQHIKDYWKESEVFHASNLNEIARTINELIDASEISVIDDEQISSGSTYSSAKIVEMIEGAGFHVAVVDELPTIGEHNTIYFVPSLDPKEKDVTDEFIWCDGRWEQIGSTRVDFSNYYTKREIDDTVDVIEGMIAEKADVQHEHQMGDVNGLDEALAGKSDTGHTHQVNEVNGLQTALDGKSNTGHTHGMSEVSGLNDALAGKSDTGHTHQMNDVSGLSDALAGKSDTGHTHEISGVNGLQNALDSKSNSGHTHEMSDVSGLSDALAGKSDTGHTHQMSEVSGLTDALSEKAEAGHTHTMADVSGLTETLEEFSETVASHINEIEDTLEVKQDKINDLDTIRSGASLGSTALQSETDPTVPAWAKTPNKPTYTASEVGALPSSTTIPSKTSQLTNDSGFLTEHQQLKTVNGESLVGTGNVTIIDDTQASLQKTYSSSKIDGMLAAPSVQEVLDILNEPEPYDDGYLYGSTDSYSGETSNPHSAGTYSYTEWASGYTDGWEVNPASAEEKGYTAALADLVSGTTTNPYNQTTEPAAYAAWNSGYQSGWTEHLATVHDEGYAAGGIDETSGATSNPYSAGTELNTEWTSGYTESWTPRYQQAHSEGQTAGGTDETSGATTNPYTSGSDLNSAWSSGYAETWAPRYQQAYTDGYSAGNTDPTSGETTNPFTAGSDLNGRWAAGYTQGWEDAHPEPQEEMHYWFVYSGDAETNGVVIDRDMFTGMISGTSSLNSSFVVEGVTYTTTKRSSDSATFGNIVIPSGKTATIYLAAVSSGSAARKVLLTNDTTGYSGEFNIDGGSSSLKVGTLTGVPGGLTYKLSRNGNENVRVSALIVKLQ